MKLNDWAESCALYSGNEIRVIPVHKQVEWITVRSQAGDCMSFCCAQMFYT